MVPVTDLPRRASSSSRRRSTLLAGLSTSLLLIGAADARAADSLSVAPSGSGQAGVAMTISAQGETSAPSTLRVFVQRGGGCASGSGGAANDAAQQAGRAGSTEVITAAPSGPFNYAGSYTPPAAGAYSICAYLFRTGPTSSASSSASQAFAVAEPAATAPGAPPPGADGEVAATPNCVVPALRGRMLETARKRLHAAGCIIGKVTRPNKRGARPVRKGGRRRILKVRTTTPKAGTVLEARGRVTVHLYYVTPKTASKNN